MGQKLIIEVTFKDTLSPQGEQDVKRAVQDFKDGMWLGTVTRAELLPTDAVSSGTEDRKP